MAAVRTTRAALSRHARRRQGPIVTISSVNAFLPDPGVIDYSAAKAALTNFCKRSPRRSARRHPRQHRQPRPGRHRPVARRRRRRRDRRAGHRATRRPSPAGAAAAASPAASPARTRSPTSWPVPCERRAANITGSDFTIDGGLITTL